MRWVRENQVTPATALAFVEQLLGHEPRRHDPDGDLPSFDPVQAETGETRGAGFRAAKALETATAWRALAETKKLSLRELVIEIGTRRGFAGTADSIADELIPFSEQHVVDGFNVSPWLVPTGLDDIVNKLVPAMQERGIYWTEYPGETLRENLGLRAPLTRRGGAGVPTPATTAAPEPADAHG